MKKAILYTIMFVVLQMAVQFLVGIAWTLATTETLDVNGLTRQFQAVCMSPTVLVVTTGVFNVVTALLYVWRGWTPVSGRYAQTRPWGVLLWCAVAALGTLVPSVYVQELLPALPDTVSEQLMQMMHVPGCFFVIAVLAPVAEELVFRGAVLRALLRWADRVPTRHRGQQGLTVRQWGAVALSAVFFALVHGNPSQMPHALLIGLLLGWLFARTGSVLPGMVLHIVNNTAAYLLAVAYPSQDIQLVDIFGGQQRMVVAALVFSLMVLLPSLLQLHQRMRRVG